MAAARISCVPTYYQWTSVNKYQMVQNQVYAFVVEYRQLSGSRLSLLADHDLTNLIASSSGDDDITMQWQCPTCGSFSTIPTTAFVSKIPQLTLPPQINRRALHEFVPQR